jgi:hypothetical protein
LKRSRAAFATGTDATAARRGAGKAATILDTSTTAATRKVARISRSSATSAAHAAQLATCAATSARTIALS